MGKYVKPYLFYAVVAGLFMIGEVLMDLIMVMDHGRIVESGTHDDLLAQKGRYYELYMRQYAGYAI